MTGNRCIQIHPELSFPCTVRGNHARCSGFDPEDLDSEFVDWPNPHYVPPTTVDPYAAQDRLRQLAAKVKPPTRARTREGFSAGLEGSQRAASAWTPEQVALVDAAIEQVATEHADGSRFTSDAIWAKLDGVVPVTKGLTARLNVAQRRALIDNTGDTTISERGGHHDHGQRLTLWHSLVSK